MLKYLHFHLGECYFLSESDHIGLFLFQLLRRPQTDARRDHVLETYQATWHVALGSYGIGNKHGFRELTGKAVHQLNSFVHALVLHELYGFVELALDHGQQAKFSIEGFMLKYGFVEEDIQFDTLQKAWTRYKSTRRKKVVSLTGRLARKQLEKGARPMRRAA